MFYQEWEQHYLRRKSSSRQSDELRLGHESDVLRQESVARNESEGHLAPETMLPKLVSLIIQRRFVVHYHIYLIIGQISVQLHPKHNNTHSSFFEMGSYTYLILSSNNLFTSTPYFCDPTHYIVVNLATFFRKQYNSLLILSKLNIFFHFELLFVY